MIKIRLFCAAGFSTGMLVNKIREAATKRGLELDIEALAQSKIEGNIEGCHLVLLGPQVAYTLPKSKEICDRHGIPIGVIDMADYGMLNGEKVLDSALKLIEDYKK